MAETREDRKRAMRSRDALDELVYRSNLLGADRSVANWGGGNTSVKTVATDFRGHLTDVMWVKGSGSDLATMGASQFTGLRLDDIQPLIERAEMPDDEMVAWLDHCLIDRNRPRPSIETLLHAFLPFPHIDHTHPDAIIALCCADNGRSLARELFGDRCVWVPYVRPGFTLAKLIATGVRDNPGAELVLMEKHGLVTWGATSEECYANTLAIINEAETFIAARIVPEAVFGGPRYAALPADERHEILVRILPVIRGAVSAEQRQLLAWDDAEDVLRFVGSHDASRLSQVGAACPDHLVHTKRTPLFVDWDPDRRDVATLIDALRTGITRFKDDYVDYFARNQRPGDEVADAAPRVILIPGVGMVSTGRSLALAQVSGALYHRAIAVMRGATALGRFTSLDETESYAVEYWPLELYKLSLLPAEAEFSRQVGFVTGGAGGIGSAICRQFAAEGMHVVVADINDEGARRVAEEINEQYGAERATAASLDVTDEAAVAAAVRAAILAYGGVDVVVNNAGLASASAVEETTLAEWQRNLDVLATGYFLVAREAFRLLKEQGLGGNLVFVASKNAIYAGKNAAAYSAA
ncbi:MAG: bifunctional rhamnulose-1-phosphate aldolase/short-chain dehydrogenase, partial [Chloroflexia bacterium]|nr:bifunctional rhamnulose-1-phosphate aldolase/short-chain dehydrogenase [Chloroflexia bacterium]